MKGFLLFFLILLVACSPAAAEEIPPPGETVVAFLTHIQLGEYEEAYALAAGEMLYALKEIEEEYRGIFESLSYGEMTETTEDGYAYVTFTINAVDFTAVMEGIMAEAFHMVFEDITVSELTDRVRTMLVDEMTADTAPILSREITVALEIYDGQWKIIIDEAFVDAITGGFFSFAEYAGQWMLD